MNHVSHKNIKQYKVDTEDWSNGWLKKIAFPSQE